MKKNSESASSLRSRAKKDPAAVKLGKKRWLGINKAKRSKLMTAAIRKRWRESKPRKARAI